MPPMLSKCLGAEQMQHEAAQSPWDWKILIKREKIETLAGTCSNAASAEIAPTRCLATGTQLDP